MENNEIKEIAVSLTADATMRKGVYANIVGIRTSSKEAILEFGLIDGENMEEDSRLVRSGTVQSRVIMTLDTLIELRDALDAHIDANLTKVER